MKTAGIRTDPFRGLRFHRSLRDAYGYDVELMRTEPVRGWGRTALACGTAVAVLLVLAVHA